ncbi:histidine triad nucleotide-binding protein [Buchnera aphidicola (Neophyllaphis varicolor)]|uniref:histidine triad nucleotide-binding protein n=1 Tax=Buchnera aphidicola TaxID=9 RepID=UPI0031B873F1
MNYEKKNIFEKIIKKEIKSEIVYQDEKITAFKDINPKAPIHIIIVPNKFIKNMNEITIKHSKIIFHMFYTAVKIAKMKNIDFSGYKLIINCNKDGGQIIPYLHMHLIGGIKLSNFIV